MRVSLDTNILISALISPAGHPAAIYDAWEDGKFTLLTCEEQLGELLATLQKPRITEGMLSSRKTHCQPFSPSAPLSRLISQPENG